MALLCTEPSAGHNTSKTGQFSTRGFGSYDTIISELCSTQWPTQLTIQLHSLRPTTTEFLMLFHLIPTTTRLALLPTFYNDKNSG